MRPFAFLPLACALLLGAGELGAQQRGAVFEAKLGAGVISLGYAKGGFAVRAQHWNQRWVPGHYDTVEQQVWIPGRCERVWCDPVYRTAVDACGRTFRVLVTPGGWKTVEHPGHYETRLVRVWVEGRWVPTGC